LVLNYIFVTSITLEKIDWNSFFPNAQEVSQDESWFSADSQYLFIELDGAEQAEAWIESSIILNYYELNAESKLYLLLFDKNMHTKLLEAVSSYSYSGTSVIGLEIMKGFMQEAKSYGTFIVPILLLLLLVLSSFEYWVNIVLEISIFNLLVFIVFKLSNFHLDSSSLLALIFLIIYAFTLFNYLHSGEINRARLAFGITISIMTTALSSFFLYLSKFGLMNGFGETMLIGLGILLVYTLSRIYFMKGFHFPFFWVKQSERLRLIYTRVFLFAFSLILIGGAWNYNSLSIDLNPVKLMSASAASMHKMKDFENKHLPSLPFIVELRKKYGSFNTPEDLNKLSARVESIENMMGLVHLYDFKQAYEEFAQESISQANPQSYAQFLLALEMMGSEMPLFNNDYTKNYITMLLPIDSSSGEISSIIKTLRGLELEDVEVNVIGNVSALDSFLSIFLQEFAIGLGVSLGFVFVFFLFYCKSFKTVVVLISTLFSLLVLLSVHVIFGIELNLMTLLSVILFAGLVTDTLIHLFICYKENGAECFESITKPILISNISMLIGLIGMFFGGSILQQFGFELSVLLASNLIFVLYIMPYLLKSKLFKSYSVEDDSCKINF